MMLLRVRWGAETPTVVEGSVVGYVNTGHEVEAVVLFDKPIPYLRTVSLQFLHPIGWREVHHNPMNLMETVP